jgi:hypothetical protein
MHIPSELLVPLIAAAIYMFVLGFLTGRLWERRRRRRRVAPPSQPLNGDPRLVSEFSAALVELYGELVELDRSLLRTFRGETSPERPALPARGDPSGPVKNDPG